jgi:hypothetical protein
MATTINPSDQTITQYNVQTGGASNLLNNVAPSATSGVPVISQGASSQPVFGTAVVAGGGTGQVTLTNHGVLIGQATSAIAATAAGSAGQVLQSGGASADPSYSTATYPTTAGTSGNVLTSDGTNWNSSAPPGGGVLNASGTLTSSQIKNLHATPITAIAAPGVGKVIQPLTGAFKFNYGGSNVFVAAASQTVTLNTAGAANTFVVVANNPTITASSNQTMLPVILAISTNASATLDNAAITFANSTATEISGNAANDNTITWNINYRIVTI